MASTSASVSSPASPTPAPAAATSVVLPAFPDVTTYKGAFTHWWSRSKDSSQLAEERVLKRGLADIPLIREGYTTKEEEEAKVKAARARGEERVARLRSVWLDDEPELQGAKRKDKDKFLNVLEVGRGDRKDEEKPVVVLHGYGGGLGFYAYNFQAITSVPNTRVYFVDLPGMGRSGRSKFPHIPRTDSTSTLAQQHSRVISAESFFVSALETLRTKLSLSKFILAGHSLGGYFSVSYALKHPERISKLILISPAGVPEWKPKGVEGLEDPGEGEEEMREALEKEMQEGQIDAAMGAGATGEQVKKDETRKTSQQTAKASPAAPKQPLKEKTWHWLWDNISPFSIIRNSSFLGSRLVGAYASNRFHSLPSEEQYEMFDYLYHLCRDKGSGEYAMSHVLGFGARARWPIVQRIEGVKVPVSFMYGGGYDWMHPDGGKRCLEIIQEKGTPLQKARSKLLLVDRSGHWLFLDNPSQFNRYIKREIEEGVKDFDS